MRISDWWIKERVRGLFPLQTLYRWRKSAQVEPITSAPPQVSQQGITVITGPRNRSDWMLFSHHWFYYSRLCFPCFDQKMPSCERGSCYGHFSSSSMRLIWMIFDWLALSLRTQQSCKSDWRVPVEAGVEGQIKPLSFQLVFQPVERINQPE